MIERSKQKKKVTPPVKSKEPNDRYRNSKIGFSRKDPLESLVKMVEFKK
jgi:hypothetical protein